MKSGNPGTISGIPGAISGNPGAISGNAGAGPPEESRLAKALRKGESTNPLGFEGLGVGCRLRAPDHSVFDHETFDHEAFDHGPFDHF